MKPKVNKTEAIKFSHSHGSCTSNYSRRLGFAQHIGRFSDILEKHTASTLRVTELVQVDA